MKIKIEFEMKGNQKLCLREAMGNGTYELPDGTKAELTYALNSGSGEPIIEIKLPAEIQSTRYHVPIHDLIKQVAEQHINEFWKGDVDLSTGAPFEAQPDEPLSENEQELPA